VENLELNQGKKPRPTSCRIFTQFTSGQKRLQGNTHCYKITHVTSLLLDLTTHHVQRHLDKRTPSPKTSYTTHHPSPPRLGQTSTHSLQERWKITPYYNVSNQANVRYNEVLICQYWKLSTTHTQRLDFLFPMKLIHTFCFYENRFIKIVLQFVLNNREKQFWLRKGKLVV